MTRTIQGYGWRPQLPDFRDHQFTVAEEGTSNWRSELPVSVDLSTSPNMPPVYDQGHLGSCTANACAAVYDFLNHRDEGSFLTPSRLFIYYMERLIENTVSQDSGAELRDGFKVLSQGVVPETEWPYDITTFTNAPSQSVLDDSKKEVALQYTAIKQDKDYIRYAISQGFPVAFGFTVYESFESNEVNNTGVLSMPTATEKVLGGHAVVIVGYDTAADTFKVRNSWGDRWGQAGYFTMPTAYVTDPNLSSDFWTVVRTT